MAAEAGYSGTPLARKLGLKDGQRAVFVALPATLEDLASARAFSEVAQTATPEEISGEGWDLIHLFTREARQLDQLPRLRSLIAPDGMIWVSWPKKASKVATDVTEDVIRARALADILVDVKVCAVDAIWSGLKLVIRKEHRATQAHA
ncbi:Protein of unknown function [Pseudooceanicola antarcticus]|uniref:DUF3052 domain-containing protein n=1 Tax=Pseudooceanicola antarcticus TaxID=1247613 RepID=A0A285IKD3_9RHOB|nr:DUF3052 family protein [Pseudooceanicola antarcticus]PJE28721.1 DUF3052 domain-containing protein [Pseudooceanicola antarcticus]SNY48429.1 Protein of unknown function [Pseudooceanicola antarcticus]